MYRIKQRRSVVSRIVVIAAGAVAALGAAQTYAWEHPCAIISAAELNAVKAKVKAGQEPWKSAAAKTVSLASGSLGKSFAFPEGYNHLWLGGSGQREVEDKYNYEYDHHRHVAEQFGTSLNNVALAWHMTEEKKYLDWAVKNLTTWFLDPATCMAPAVPGGTTVGIDASFTNVLSGMDIIWPALPAELQTKLMAWVKTYNQKHSGHRDSGGNNRGDAWAMAEAVIGALAENRSSIDVAAGQMRTRMNGFKSMGPTYYAFPDEGKAESTIQYNYFDIKSVTTACEVARHFGIDLFSYGASGSGVSKMEGLLNWYAALMLNPRMYPNFDRDYAARGSRFLSVDFAKCWSIWELAYSFKPNKPFVDLINKRGRPINFDENEPMLFISSTLTHARGAYPFVAGATAASAPMPVAFSRAAKASVTNIAVLNPGRALLGAGAFSVLVNGRASAHTAGTAVSPNLVIRKRDCL